MLHLGLVFCALGSSCYEKNRPIWLERFFNFWKKKFPSPKYTWKLFGFLVIPSWTNTVCHFVEANSELLKLADIFVHKVIGKLCSFEANSVNDTFKTCFPTRFMSTNTSQSKEPNIKAMCFLKVLRNITIVENWDLMNFYKYKFWFCVLASLTF